MIKGALERWLKLKTEPDPDMWSLYWNVCVCSGMQGKKPRWVKIDIILTQINLFQCFSMFREAIFSSMVEFQPVSSLYSRGTCVSLVRNLPSGLSLDERICDLVSDLHVTAQRCIRQFV